MLRYISKDLQFFLGQHINEIAHFSSASLQIWVIGLSCWRWRKGLANRLRLTRDHGLCPPERQVLDLASGGKILGEFVGWVGTKPKKVVILANLNLKIDPKSSRSKYTHSEKTHQNCSKISWHSRPLGEDSLPRVWCFFIKNSLFLLYFFGGNLSLNSNLLGYRWRWQEHLKSAKHGKCWAHLQVPSDCPGMLRPDFPKKNCCWLGKPIWFLLFWPLFV